MSEDNPKTTVINLEMAPGKWVMVNMSYLDRRHIIAAVSPLRRYVKGGIVHLTYAVQGVTNEG